MSKIVYKGELLYNKIKNSGERLTPHSIYYLYDGRIYKKMGPKPFNHFYGFSFKPRYQSCHDRIAVKKFDKKRERERVLSIKNKVNRFEIMDLEDE